MRISYWSSDVCSSDLQWVIGEDTPIPIVPIVVNCFAPPLPSLSRVVAVGHALRDAIAALATDKRVAIVATGGLSHRLPLPDCGRPVGEAEEFHIGRASCGGSVGRYV